MSGRLCRGSIGERESVRHRRLLAAGVATVLTGTVVTVASGQPPAEPLPRVPKFVVSPSPIELRGDVRPRQYLGVVGRRAAWLGWEDGEAELWVHPIKLASDFALAFKIPDYEEPIRGADLARTVEIRPELTTITYSHATFTVREHILAPLDEPGLLVLLDVASVRPLEMLASFRVVFQYAWPGAFGGQYVVWDDSRKAFLLSESLRQRSAYIGSPWASGASSHPAHALPDAPSVFRIPVDLERAGREFIPIVIAAGVAPRDQVQGTYRRLLERAEALYLERREHAERLRRETTRIETPESGLDLAFEWAKVNLDEQTVCNPDLGCGLVAGWGPSGRSTRPGFGWFFGGDAAINSLAMSLARMGAAVADGLRFLAKYQRTDGKIPHEISQAAARLPWFTDFPYAYYHADTTPYFLVALWRYVRATGDERVLAELWPAARRAYAWCLTTDTDGDGLIENTAGGLGAVEVGALGERLHQDIYLAAVWVAALEAMEDLASLRGDTSLALEARDRWARATATLSERYWLESAGYYAFGLLLGGNVNDALTVWPATALAFGLLDPTRGRLTLAALSARRMTTDWGVRMLAADHPLYGPLEYNMGAVWPFVTGFVALAHYKHGRPWAGYPLVEAIARLTFDFARGRHPELLSGEFYRPLDTAVPQQFFATSMLVTPVIAGLFGWEPDAPRRRAVLAPQIPPAWERAAARQLPVGDATVDAEFEQRRGVWRATLTAQGGPLRLLVTPGLPLGATNVVWKVDGKRVAPQKYRSPRGDDPAVEIEVGEQPTRVEVTWQGGLAPEVPVSALAPGDASHGLRLLAFEFDRNGWRATLEGDAGRVYEWRVIGERVSEARGAEIVASAGGVTTLRVRCPEAATPTSVVEIFLQRSPTSGGRPPAF